jgi:DNA-directed RNA polymerase subunit D
MAKIRIIDKSEDKMRIELRDTDPSFANALRRTVLTEVPFMAIDEVDIGENTSSIFNEFIAHRIGQVPLITDIKSYKLPDRCCGGQCARCSTIATLEAKGPGTVYSKELKFKDKNIKAVEGDIPIIILADGQRLRLEAKAVLGYAKNHAKWQGAHCTYKLLPVVEISKECDACESCVKACPRNIIEMAGKKAKVTDINACIECGECARACAKGAIKVSHAPDVFIMTLESYGGLPAKSILSYALDRLENKVTEFEEMLKKK